MREENCLRVCSPSPLDSPQTSVVATSVLVAQSSFESCGSASLYKNDLDHYFTNEEEDDNNFQVSLGVVLSKLPEFQESGYEAIDNNNSLDEINETVISLLNNSVLGCQPVGETL